MSKVGRQLPLTEMLHPFAQAELGMPDGSRAGCRTAWMMISVSVAS
jgi:hypothetical protein